MLFGKARMMKLSGLLREGVEEAGACECGGTVYEDSGCSECGGGAMYEGDPKDESKDESKDEMKHEMKDESGTYEVDDDGLKEIEESIKFRRMVRGELEQMWATGQVFGKKAPRRNGVTMGFKGIGFK
jgi:hypothetical protein